MPVSFQDSKPPALLRSVAAQCDLHAEVEVSFRQLASTRNVVILIQYRKSINFSLIPYLQLQLISIGLSIVLSHKSTSCVCRSRDYMERKVEL